MFTHSLSVFEILTVALASGGIAEFLLRTGLSESWVAIGGLLGVAMDRYIPISLGPTLFGHCLLDCVATSAIMMLALWFLHLPLRGITRVAQRKRRPNSHRLAAARAHAPAKRPTMT